MNDQAPKRVLVIDDDLYVRRSIRIVLEGAGYEVSDVGDADVGIGLHCTTPFDVVIVDLLMPRKEGLETIRELKRDFPTLPIMAISGGGDIIRKNFVQAAEAFGATATLKKPFDGDDLLNTLKAVVELGGGASGGTFNSVSA